MTKNNVKNVQETDVDEGLLADEDQCELRHVKQVHQLGDKKWYDVREKITSLRT